MEIHYNNTNHNPNLIAVVNPINLWSASTAGLLVLSVCCNEIFDLLPVLLISRNPDTFLSRFVGCLLDVDIPLVKCFIS